MKKSLIRLQAIIVIPMQHIIDNIYKILTQSHAAILISEIPSPKPNVDRIFVKKYKVHDD
jgi:hypothetical protein